MTAAKVCFDRGLTFVLVHTNAREVTPGCTVSRVAHLSCKVSFVFSWHVHVSVDPARVCKRWVDEAEVVLV